MEKVKLDINKNNAVHWAFIEMIGEKDKEFQKIMEQAERYENGFVLNVELKVNGIEFSFENIITQLVKCQNEVIKKAVKEELENKFYEITSRANEIINNLDYINLELEGE